MVDNWEALLSGRALESAQMSVSEGGPSCGGDYTVVKKEGEAA